MNRKLKKRRWTVKGKEDFRKKKVPNTKGETGRAHREKEQNNSRMSHITEGTNWGKEKYKEKGQKKKSS